MRLERRTKIGFAVAAFCMWIGLLQAQPTPAQQTEQQAGRKAVPAQRGGFMQLPVDPRVQNRTYLFKETNEEIPYALFVSSKVSKDKKNPVIVTLHGLGAPPTIMLRGNALDLAEEGGYILVAPMGYNTRGWYGIPMGPKPDLTKVPPKTADATPTVQPGAKESAAMAKPPMFDTSKDPPNLRELSEKDVMNVLDLIRKEFNVDERRIYLMGHSMGGAGALYLGIKYPEIWAAIAAIAPAAFGLQPDSLAKIKDMPVMIVQGDADNLVPVDIARRWVDKLKELNMTYTYNEIRGGDHGSVIFDGNPGIFAFFAQHSKPVSR